MTARGRQLEGVLYELARFGLPSLDEPTAEQPAQPWLVPGGAKAMARLELLPDEPMTFLLELDEATLTVEVLPLLGDVDATLRSSLAVLLWLRRGDLDVGTARADGLLSITGSAPGRRALEVLYGLNRRDPVPTR